MTIGKEKIDAALARLAEQFPQTFVLEKHLPHRPLKVGIAADIRAALPDIDRLALGVALKVYTHRIVYLQAVVVAADRVDLDGNPAGQVTAAEAGHAIAVLVGIRAQRQAKRSAAVTPAKPEPAPIASPPVVPTKLKGRPVLHLRLDK